MTDLSQQMPSGLRQVLDWFAEQNISFLLLKADHIFAGANKNLDVLLETQADFEKAQKILQQHGFVIRLPQRVEKYKEMWIGRVPELSGKGWHSVHLHQEIAWHGMKALDKKPVFSRKVLRHSHCFITGREDTLLLHAAHVLFENFQVTGKEKLILAGVSDNSLDWSYLQQQLQKNRWEKAFRSLVAENQQRLLESSWLESSWKVSRSRIIHCWLQKLTGEPATAAYLLQKAMKKIIREIFPGRKGCLIAIIGVNGTGKTTLAHGLVDTYAPLAHHLGIRPKYYYFGWSPTFPLTRVLSYVLEKKKKRLFQEVALQESRIRWSLQQEFLFLYQFLELFYRYRIQVLPHLKTGELVICDRYFYDLFGQYPSSRRSVLFPWLLKLFPVPEVTFLLQAPLEKLQQRSKASREGTDELFRTVLPSEYLLRQQKNYASLAQKIPVQEISTADPLDSTVASLLHQSWKALFRRTG